MSTNRRMPDRFNIGQHRNTVMASPMMDESLPLAIILAVLKAKAGQE